MADIAHRHAGLWALDSLNGNCGSTARGCLERTSADVCLLQETRYHAADIHQASRAVPARWWLALSAPAWEWPCRIQLMRLSTPLECAFDGSGLSAAVGCTW